MDNSRISALQRQVERELDRPVTEWEGDRLAALARRQRAVMAAGTLREAMLAVGRLFQAPRSRVKTGEIARFRAELKELGATSAV